MISILFLIDSCFCISFLQAFISKFIWIYYIHKALRQRSISSLGALPLQMNKTTLAISEYHCKNTKMSKVTLFTWLIFSHMIPDQIKSSLIEVHEGFFMNEIDSFDTSEVTWVSMEMKYRVQVKTYRRKWGIIQR